MPPTFTLCCAEAELPCFGDVDGILDCHGVEHFVRNVEKLVTLSFYQSIGIQIG